MFFLSAFLDALSHLYKGSYPSIRPSVCLSIHPATKCLQNWLRDNTLSVISDVSILQKISVEAIEFMFILVANVFAFLDSMFFIFLLSLLITSPRYLYVVVSSICIVPRFQVLV